MVGQVFLGGVHITMFLWLPLDTPTLEKNFDPEKSTGKCILRNFICHLDRHFLKFLAI